MVITELMKKKRGKKNCSDLLLIAAPTTYYTLHILDSKPKFTWHFSPTQTMYPSLPSVLLSNAPSPRTTDKDICKNPKCVHTLWIILKQFSTIHSFQNTRQWYICTEPGRVLNTACIQPAPHHCSLCCVGHLTTG